eukprot:1626170-Pyramimonas_sp.AAC.1
MSTLGNPDEPETSLQCKNLKHEKSGLPNLDALPSLHRKWSRSTSLRENPNPCSKPAIRRKCSIPSDPHA